MHLSDFRVSLSDCSRLTKTSQPQISRKDNPGVFPVHISYGVLTTDLDGTLFSVKADVSRAYPQNDKGRSYWLIINQNISNKVRLRRSYMPFL
jgi:hypothetical protein